jgi:S-disulfanyl-L-cysteine oxidoreductase SoxD
LTCHAAHPLLARSDGSPYTQSRHLVTASATTLLIILGAATASAQNASASPQQTSRGAYTEAQAARGEATYRANCTSCHATSAHTGDTFILAWNSRTAFDLFDLIRTTMPVDNPGRLSREQYADIVAYLLKLNRLPPGERPLPADDEGLKQVRIEAKPTSAP